MRNQSWGHYLRPAVNVSLGRGESLDFLVRVKSLQWDILSRSTFAKSSLLDGLCWVQITALRCLCGLYCRHKLLVMAIKAKIPGRSWRKPPHSAPCHQLGTFHPGGINARLTTLSSSYVVNNSHQERAECRQINGPPRLPTRAGQLLGPLATFMSIQPTWSS